LFSASLVAAKLLNIKKLIIFLIQLLKTLLALFILIILILLALILGLAL